MWESRHLGLLRTKTLEQEKKEHMWNLGDHCGATDEENSYLRHFSTNFSDLLHIPVKMSCQSIYPCGELTPTVLLFCAL